MRERENWLALGIGFLVGTLVVALGMLYLWSLGTEVGLRISEMIHG